MGRKPIERGSYKDNQRVHSKISPGQNGIEVERLKAGDEQLQEKIYN